MNALILIALPIIIIIYYIYRQFTGKSNKVLKDSSVRHALKVISKNSVSHDTVLIKVALPTNKHVLGLPVGKCIRVHTQVDGEDIHRKYTPVSDVNTPGSFNLLIKVYHANVHPKFPAGGKMTQFLNGCSLGDYLSIDGPHGNIEYHGRGRFQMRKDGPCQHFDRVLMIAGGSGITPMSQILQSSFSDASDSTQFSLVYANKSVKDILLRETLVMYERHMARRFKVIFTVDEVKEEDGDYSGHTGFITEDLIIDACPYVSTDVLVLICGPPPMIDFACMPALKRLEVNNKLIHMF